MCDFHREVPRAVITGRMRIPRTENATLSQSRTFRMAAQFTKTASKLRSVFAYCCKHGGMDIGFQDAIATIPPRRRSKFSASCV